jgi:hypothetical protein
MELGWVGFSCKIPLLSSLIPAAEQEDGGGLAAAAIVRVQIR